MKIYEMTFGDSGIQGRDIFFSPNNSFNITRFQRPYVWKNYQIQGVIQDIKYILKTNKDVAWPSMLIQESSQGNINLQNYDLGDGQQRSTTVFLFLTAIWHKWKADYREEGIAKEDEFFNSIFYIGSDRLKGILGSNVFGELRTAINFQTPAASKKIHNLFMTDVITEENIKKIMKSVNDKENSYQLYNSFLIIWEELKKISYSEKELKNIAEILLTKIIFPVVVYSEEEDMFRAFSNTNSFGESLTQSDLVKAEFFGRVKAIDVNLANKIADHWNDEMDTWFAKHKTEKFSFDSFLIEEFNIFNNWNSFANRVEYENKGKNTLRSRWLKTEWQKYFDKKAENLNNDDYELKEFYTKTFENMKEHFKITKLIVEKQSPTVLSKEWEIQYTHNVFPSLPMGLFFQLNDDLREKDFIKVMQLLRKYYFYNAAVLKDKNPNQLLFHIDSPIRNKNKKLKFEIFEDYFVNKVTKRGLG